VTVVLAARAGKHSSKRLPSNANQRTENQRVVIADCLFLCVYFTQ
jgi:hypothetical protein